MQINFEPAEFNNDTYLITNSQFVEDVSHSFTSATGYSKSDFSGKHISEVMQQLFGFDLNPENSSVGKYFLFKKSCQAIEVRMVVGQLEEGSRMLYRFQQIPNQMLESELSLVGKLLGDNFSGVGLYSCPDFRLLKANQSYLEYLKGTFQRSGNMVSMCLDQIIPDDGLGNIESRWQSILATGETICLKEQQSGSEEEGLSYWNETIIPIAKEGSVEYIVTILDEVTDCVNERKHLEERCQKLQKSLEKKDEMLMLISHELKTPLSIITSSIQTIELICKNELTDRVRKYLNKIKQNAYCQLKLINNILDNTRVNAGIFKMNRSSVDIVHLTKTIIESISVFAERKNIKISFSTKIGQAIILADADIYERILLNLLSNAVKFTPEGKSIEVSIYRLVLQGNPKLCIQVKDNGIGIPNEKKELIFERFGRVDPLISRHCEGTGIGLYLVKMLIALLDGEIKVESKEGVGSSFTVILPFVQTNIVPVETIIIDQSDEELATASAIEFSDIYYGT